MRDVDFPVDIANARLTCLRQCDRRGKINPRREDPLTSAKFRFNVSCIPAESEGDDV